MKEQKKGASRDTLLELGAIIPQTDEEMAIYEEANSDSDDDIKVDEKLLDLEYVLSRGKALAESEKSIFEAEEVSTEGYAMAAREGKEISQEIRERMNEARIKAKNDEF